MSGEYQHGLCSCCENCKVCICAIFCPCYVAGKIAEKVGDSCCLCCIVALVPVADCLCRGWIRAKVREQKGISGSIVTDMLYAWCCYPCTLCQDGMEVGALDMAAQDMARE